ncbi:MAG: DUF4185 domain-containing protein [Legionellaceae bacterium]|nr:DUF4185 domain-containing protein [Legionellaceae bacterium]
MVLIKYYISMLLLFASLQINSQCVPTFNYQSGWMGGDAVYSVPLENQKTLWLFGDTFISKNQHKSRIGASIISNSVAISQCIDNQFYIKYLWLGQKTTPQAFIPDMAKDIKYWPQAGFYYKEHAYVFWRAIKTLPSEKPPFNFQGIDTLITKMNPSVSIKPENWVVDTNLLNTGVTYAPGLATVVSPPYIYMFGTIDDNNSKRLILQRIHVEHLDKFTKNIETLTKTSWKKHINLRIAKTITPFTATEMSVLYNKKIKQWQMIYSVYPNSVMSRTSKTLAGPWSKEQEIYSINMQYKDEFCYGAKAHDQYDNAITYVCNSLDFNELIHNLKLYKPTFTDVPCFMQGTHTV